MGTKLDQVVDHLMGRTMAALERAGLRCVASVREGQHNVDLAFLGLEVGPMVVRCVSHAMTRDYSALGAMLREGPFRRAILICEDPEAPREWIGVEIWPIGEVDERALALALGGALA